MKYIFLLLLSISAFAQERYVEYGAPERKEDAENDSIYWLGADKIHQEFTLQGSKYTCRLTVIPQGTVLLEQQLAGSWQQVDSLYYSLTPYDKNGNYFTPQFEITDFNHDGLEDFVFLSGTTMHGILPYSIYLQHNDGALHLLHNITYNFDENTWPGASFDPATQTISCTLPGGVYGESWQNTYRLNGFEAIPLQMDVEERNEQTQFGKQFKGQGNTWQQTGQTACVALGLGFEDYNTMEVLHFRLEQNGDGLLQLYCTINDYGFQSDDGMIKTLVDTFEINGFASELGAGDDYQHYPGFLITDFNHDGNQDLVFYLGVDVHSSLSALIFLSDPKTKKLLKLQNTPEDTDVWDAPEYNPKTKTITCRRMSGNAGLSFTSTYRLKGFTAQPLTKEVQDRTNVNGETGKGYSESSYTGKKGKWKLESTVTDE